MLFCNITDYSNSVSLICSLKCLEMFVLSLSIAPLLASVPNVFFVSLYLFSHVTHTLSLSFSFSLPFSLSLSLATSFSFSFTLSLFISPPLYLFHSISLLPLKTHHTFQFHLWSEFLPLSRSPFIPPRELQLITPYFQQTEHNTIRNGPLLKPEVGISISKHDMDGSTGQLWSTVQSVTIDHWWNCSG